jgi:hypothetical protein
MNANDLQNVLNQVFGQHGMNLPVITQQLTNAVNNMAPAPARELSLVKISDFSGADDEDPYEWTDQFLRAAEANRWEGDARLIAIAKGYLKGAAADWVKTATAVGAVNQIVHWNNPQNHNATSFIPRFIEKFAPESKQNKWYYELMTLRQLANEY